MYEVLQNLEIPLTNIGSGPAIGVAVTFSMGDARYLQGQGEADPAFIAPGETIAIWRYPPGRDAPGTPGTAAHGQLVIAYEGIYGARFEATQKAGARPDINVVTLDNFPTITGGYESSL